MDTNAIIAIIVVILGAAIIAIRVVQFKKKYKNLEEFIDDHGDAIIKILKDAIVSLKTKMSDYGSRKEYETALIEVSVRYFKELASQLGVPSELIDALSDEKIAQLIYKFFNKNKVDAFTVLDSVEISKNKEIIDEKVVNVLGANIEDLESMENSADSNTSTT